MSPRLSVWDGTGPAILYQLCAAVQHVPAPEEETPPRFRMLSPEPVHPRGFSFQHGPQRRAMGAWMEAQRGGHPGPTSCRPPRWTHRGAKPFPTPPATEQFQPGGRHTQG